MSRLLLGQRDSNADQSNPPDFEEPDFEEHAGVAERRDAVPRHAGILDAGGDAGIAGRVGDQFLHRYVAFLRWIAFYRA
jgi:hypothetical protein